MIRPHRGSRAMSTMGAKAQWMPTARASRAATAWPRSIVSTSHEGAIATGPGGGVPRDGAGEGGSQAMDDVKAEQRGDAEAVALDGEPLEPVDLGGVGDEQQ